MEATKLFCRKSCAEAEELVPADHSLASCTATITARKGAGSSSLACCRPGASPSRGPASPASAQAPARRYRAGRGTTVRFWMRLTSEQTATAERVMTVSNGPGSAPDAGRTRRGLRAGLTGRGGSGGRRMWDFGPGDAEAVLAEARKALFVMVGFLALIWIIQIANWADQYRLAFEYGIRPRDAGSLPDILSAPFLHFSWSHIEGNSGP